jgi:hypothetical protein
LLAAALFRRFLFLASCSLARRLLLGNGEALHLFAADRAFPHVISTAIVSHNLLYSPACRAVAITGETGKLEAAAAAKSESGVELNIGTKSRINGTINGYQGEK